MSAETREGIIENVFRDVEDGDDLTFAFQGGEPTMAGLSWFEQFAAAISGRNNAVTVHYSLQTNGLLIDEAWCAFLKKNNFLVGLSVDAGARFHDPNRIDAAGEGTWRTVMARKKLLDSFAVEYNILTVLTNDLAGEPERVWRFITNEKIRFIQFIPCLEPVAGEDNSNTAYTLHPARFASFYSRLLSYWKHELEKGSYVSVKFFDDIANYFLKGIPSACGINGHCHSQYVVEADGGVYPCDFYVLDKYRSGDLTRRTLREIFDSPVTQEFLREERKLPPLCGNCPYYQYCGGGCKRMEKVMYWGKTGTLCGYRNFLDKCLEPLLQLVRTYFP
jgi:uncharacterized protein